jgi:rRNA maturation endonuclease Nob1
MCQHQQSTMVVTKAVKAPEQGVISLTYNVRCKKCKNLVKKGMACDSCGTVAPK